jgi:two-component system chemotaxis response regulator CheY
MAEGEKRRILVADDDDLIRKMVSDVLSMHSYIVTSVMDGESAIAHYEKHDLLITDYNMGLGMTGVELAKKIKERTPEYKIIVMSGNVDSAKTEKEVLEAGADDFIPKPVYTDVLLSKVKKHLSEENQQSV